MNKIYDPKLEHDACGVGFIAQLDGTAKRQTVTKAISAMARLKHRGGHAHEENGGDGAGLLLPLPWDFFASEANISMSGINKAVGQFFLPQDENLRRQIKKQIDEICTNFELNIENWRNVPVNGDAISKSALDSMPHMMQLFISGGDSLSADEFERKLYIVRKNIQYSAWKTLKEHGQSTTLFAIPSLSSRTITYKAMLTGGNLSNFYKDLADSRFMAKFVVFHERFSTNTMPSWHLAQPFRMVAHNGEINTLSGNSWRMNVREEVLNNIAFKGNLDKILPAIEPNGSDSASFDNVLELLVHSGYDLNHALMMMVPEPFGAAFIMGDNKRAFYEYHSSLMEAWDGPTAMVFTDGKDKVGALLDRNGLRPCRYSVSKYGEVILASETGVDDISQKEVLGQLQPRKMLVADMSKHRLVTDAEIKGHTIREKPYRRYLKQYCVNLNELSYENNEENSYNENLAYFGYNADTVKKIIVPMANDAQEPVGAMGLDNALAILDNKSSSLFNYFKQKFAQVTNPAIDPLREELSMSLMDFIGSEFNILESKPENCTKIKISHPFLTAQDMQRIRNANNENVRAATIDICFKKSDDLEAVLENIFVKAKIALENGANILVLSDINTNAENIPAPILLVVSGLHHYLIKEKLRHLCSIIVESAQAFEVMHMGMLLAFGAKAIYPYGAYKAIDEAIASNAIKNLPTYEAKNNYVAALKKGILKILARLGISTLRSFYGSQCFEAVGIDSHVIDKYFEGTNSRIGGLSLEQIKDEAINNHKDSKDESAIAGTWSKQAIKLLHQTVRENDVTTYDDFVKYQKSKITNLRALFEYRNSNEIDINKVEEVSNILPRFFGAPMSLGSLSREAHETIALACNELKMVSNCGEGGEEIERSKNDKMRSRARQVASGRFGVTAEYLSYADEIQIKVAQGAKPGEGGQLPAYKVSVDIAKVRKTMPGVTLISPPPHHDIYSIEDLAQLIYDLKQVNPRAKISVKLVAQAGIGTVAVGVVKAGADIICVSGHDGGTGAAPLSAIYHVGLPWEMGIVEVHKALIFNKLRDVVTLQVDGQIRSGDDVVKAFLLGADEVGFGTAMLVAMGCVFCRNCHKGKCPVGIATQEDKLRAKFNGEVVHLTTYFKLIADEVRTKLAKLGYTKIEEIIGRADLLEINQSLLPQKANKLDLADLLSFMPVKAVKTIKHSEEVFDDKICLDPILSGSSKRVVYEGQVVNTDRAVGTKISGILATHDELEDESVCLNLQGSAGQSLGAFLGKGISIRVSGDANDYVGKGLCGGLIIVNPDKDFNQDQAVVGNVALYGASSGQAYFAGTAGNRFAVRNSGATAVVEGVGDHACEYMTGGTIVVIGSCGYNFAAGMSGGVAYVYDRDEKFQNRCNTDSVDLESVYEEDDINNLRELLSTHAKHTNSLKAKKILEAWEDELPFFIKVMPLDYKKALERQILSSRHGQDTSSATEEVFTR